MAEAFAPQWAKRTKVMIVVISTYIDRILLISLQVLIRSRCWHTLGSTYYTCEQGIVERLNINKTSQVS